MPTVISEELATQSSPFAPLDKNISSGYSYLSIRRSRYWKQTMAAWSSIDAFCSSIYGRKNPGLSVKYYDSPTDDRAFHERQSPISSSANGDQSADVDLVSVNESQNRLSDSDQRVDHSDGSVSDRNFESKLSRLLKSSSASSLARDVTLLRSTSTEDATPSSYKIRQQSSSEVHSRKDTSQVKEKGYNSSGACHLRESSSATLNSNCQRMAATSGSSSSGSCLDSSQVTSQDHSIERSQNAKVVSSSSASKQSTQKVLYSSRKHSEDNHNPVDRHSNDVGRNQDKLCGVCQQPYINHNELVLLSPGLFRQTIRCRRIAPRKAKGPTNRRWLYRRSNDMYNPHLSYCSFLASNLLLAEALQTWLGRRLQSAKSLKNADKSVKDADKSVKDADERVNDADTSVKDADTSVKDADDGVEADDSSVETETFSESVRSKLYELLMQIKSRMSSDSSASDAAKKMIASGTDDVDERNTIPKDDPEDIQKVGHPADRYNDTKGRRESDAGLQAAGGRHAMQKYATSKGVLNSAADSSQIQLEDNLSNVGSIADHQDMSNTRQNLQNAKSTEMDYYQDVCLQPRKTYIDGSRRKDYHGSSKMKLSAHSQRNQENPDSKIATKGVGRHSEKSWRVSNRKQQQNEDVAWAIMEDGRPRFRNKETSYLQQKHYTDGPSRYEFERVDRKNMVVADEGETGQGRTGANDRSSVKENMAYDTIDAPVKKYHYKCVKIEGRETILKLEHDPNKICSLGNVSKTDQPKKNEESVVEEYVGFSGNQHDRLEQQSKDCKVENVKKPEEPVDFVKFELENEKHQGTIPCREPKLREAQVEAPAEVGDGKDKGHEGEEVKPRTVFQKKHSGWEAEKERRILRRFARQPADDVKVEPESERSRRPTPCREPKATEAQVEAQAEVGDGKDKVGEEVKYSKVFHKKYSGSEAEKERRMLRRIAREQMKAHLEKGKLEGETAPLRPIPSWSETYVKSMKRRQKHSNKQCIIGKQITSKVNVEESQQKAAEEQTDNVEEREQKADEEQADNVEESQQKADEEPTENAQEKVQASIVDTPLASKPPELARQLPGLWFFDRIFGVPVPTQMTPARKLEIIDPPPLTHTMAADRAAYLSAGSQDVPELSTGSDRPAGIKSSQYTDNTCGVATDNEEKIHEVESEIFQVPLLTQLTPKRKFKLDNPSTTNKFQTTRSANSKGSLDINKRYEKIGIGEEITAVFEESLHVEETNIESTGVRPRSKKGHFVGPTQLNPKRTFRIDEPSSMKAINTAKASQDIFEVSKKPVKGTEIKSPGFKNNTLVQQRDKKITRQLKTSEIIEIQEPTQFTPAREFKLDNPNYTNKSLTTSGANLKSSNDMQKKFQKINMNAEKKSSQRKASVSVKQPNSKIVMQLPGSEISQHPAPTQVTPKRKFKIDHPSTTKHVKAVKLSQEMLESTNKSQKEKDIKFNDFKVKTLAEQTEKEIKRQLMESEASEVQVPTLLSSKGKFKIYSQSYNTKLKASAASFFSKTIPDYSKSPKKIALGEDMTPEYFKDDMSVQQAGIEAITEIPGSETPEVLLPTKFTSKRQFKKGLPDRTKKLKASNEADFSKANPETMKASKTADIGEEMESRQFEDMLDEQTHHEAAESEKAGPPDSPESIDVDAKEGDLLDTAIQKVEAGDSVGEDISGSQESLLQQIYSKLLEPVGLKIINDLEQFGHSNRPLKYRIPASHTLYPQPASRPVYLSEFLTWLGVKQTDDSSSDDEEEDDDEKPYNRSKRNKYDRSSHQGFPENVKVADSFTYLRIRTFDNLKNERNAILSPPAESSFISQESLQMYANEGVSEEISIDAADEHMTPPLYEETSQTLSDHKDATTADSSNVQSDKAAADKSLSPLPEYKVNSKCESSSKVFHKKYSPKRKILEKEMLGGQSQVPWRKKERTVDEGTAAKRRENKKVLSPKCLFAKQAERTRQKEKREKEVKQGQEGKLSQKRHFKKGQKCSLDKENIEEPMEASDIDEKPCRACMSSEEYYQAMEKFSRMDGNHDQPSEYSNGHENPMEPSREFAEEIGVLEEEDPGMLTPLDKDAEAEREADVMESVVAGFQEEQGDQQTALENSSMLKAITQLLREIPVDVLNKKFLKELASFQERNTPLKFKIPSTNERVAVQQAEPIYLSQLLAFMKIIRSLSSYKSDEDYSPKASQGSITQGGRVVRQELPSTSVRGAGSSSHMVARRSDHAPKTWSRAGFLSVPMAGTSSSREVSYVSNVQAQDDDVGQSVSYTASDATETVAESNIPELSQAEPVEAGPVEAELVEAEQVEAEPVEAELVEAEPMEAEPVPDEQIEPRKPPSKIFHKQFSTEGKLREKEILGSWGKQTCKEEKDTKNARHPCRDPPVVKEPPPKKNVFSKQAEKTEERELQEKEFEKEYAEFFGESPGPSLKGEDEAVGVEIGEDVGGDDKTGVSGDGETRIIDDGGTGVSGDGETRIIDDGGTGVSGDGETRIIDDGGTGISGEAADVDVSTGLGLDHQETDLPLKIGDEKARENYEARAEGGLDEDDLPSSSNQLLQEITETLVNQQQPLTASATTGNRTKPYRYTIPSAFEMYQPPEAHPIYMARETSDQIKSFLGLRQEGSLDEEAEAESGGGKALTSTDRRRLGIQNDVLKTSPPWRALNVLKQMKSQFFRDEMASTSTSPEYQRTQFWDFQPSVGRGMHDYSTRAFNKVTSPTRQRNKTKPHVDSAQRSPSVIEAVQSQLQDFRTSLGRFVYYYNIQESNEMSLPTSHRDKTKPHVDFTQRSPSVIEAVQSQFWDIQSSVDRSVRDYSTRAFNKMTSPTSQRDKTKADVDSAQRSPSVLEAVQSQFWDIQSSVGRSVRDYSTRAFNKMTSPTSQRDKTKADVDSAQRSPSVIEAVQSQLQDFRTSLGRFVYDYNTQESNKMSSPTSQRDKTKPHVDSTQRSSSATEDVQRQPREFRTSDRRGLYDYNTREFSKIGSPTSHRDKTKPHVDSTQRSPSPTEDVQREFGDRGFERYQGSKGYNIGSPGLEVLPEEVSQLEVPHRSRPTELFRWVGKSRIEDFTQPNTFGVVSENTQDFPVEPVRLAQELSESSLQMSETDQRNVQRTEPYFKGTFPQAFEESTIGSIALRVLNEIVDYGRRNVPLKFEARQQQFLEMPSAAQPMYISRKNWDSSLGYIGLGSGEEEMDENERCESEPTSSSEVFEEPARVLPAVKQPHEDFSIMKPVDEELESNPEEYIPKCVLRGGIVESHRELTFCCPSIPLPKRVRSVTRRRGHRFEHDYQTTSRAPFVRRETICYGRTKQLKRNCDIWSKSELDRSSHFCRSGRYNRKHLFRKRLNLRNILSECGKSKEWKRLEDNFKERSTMVRYGYDKDVDSVDNDICDPVRKYGSDPFKKVNITDDVTNSQSGLTPSMKYDFLTSPSRFKAYSYDSDRCSNYRGDDPWAFPDSRMALDMRPEAQGDYLHHALPASRNSCYGSSANNARKDARTLLHSVKVNEGSHELLSSLSQLKSNAAGMPSFANTPGSFGKCGITRNIGASKRGLSGQGTNRWRGSSAANWGGCHNNVMPLTTASTDRKLGRGGSFFDSSNSEVVKPLGHQQNRYGYSHVKTQCPYTSSYYSDQGNKLYSLIHSSAARLPSRTY